MKRVLRQGMFALGVVALVLVPAVSASGSGDPSGARAATSVATSPGQPALPTIAFPLAPSAEVPTFTVTPSTDLVTGQSVAITGAGFVGGSPNGVGVAQCRAGAFGQADCDLSNLLIPDVDASGAFSATFNVRRTLNIGGTTLRCDDAPGTCILGGAVIADQTIAGFVPLSFDPNAPRPNPQLVVTPNEGILNGDTVSVTGSGFVPNSSLQLAQCAVGSSRCGGYIYVGEEGPGVDAGGNFATDFTLRLRARLADGSTTNCIAVACEIRSYYYPDPDYNVSVPVAFDPNQPIPPPPTVSVDPNVGLADRQSVAVTGANFDANAYVQLSVCLPDNTGCSYLSSGSGQSATDGSFSRSVVLRRLVLRYLYDETTGQETTETVDCAPDLCVLRAATYDDFETQVDTPLNFDPNLPLPDPPTIAVDPSTNLPYRASVAVTGTGFTPGDFVYAEQCLQTASSGNCRSYAYGSADGSGNVSIQLGVRRRITNYNGGFLDCTDVGTTCTVTLQGNDGIDRASAPISFDPNAPIPPPPTASATPNTNLGWREVVSVTGSGFTPNGQVIVQQCTVISLGEPPVLQYAQCVGGNYNNLPSADADGNLNTTFNARKIITNGSSEPVDCSALVGKCFLRVAEYDNFGEGDAQADVPLGFDPASLQPPGPPVTVTPSTGLSNGDTVDVSGSGFTAGATIGMAVCTAATTSINNCDISHPNLQTADANGGFQTTFVVNDQFTTSSGPVDCAAAPGTCVLGVANIGDYIEFSLTPLSFGPDISVLDTTLDEGTGGDTPAPVTVHLSRPTDRAVGVHWVAADGTATEGSDYTGTEGDVLIPAGATDAEIPASVIGDAIDERTERFTVKLTAATGGPVVDDTATVTIRDDDRQPRMTVWDATIVEGDSGTSTAFVPVVLSGPSGRDITVSFRTHHGSARSGSDFVRTRVTVVIPAGTGGWIVAIPIVGDHSRERTESFTLEAAGVSYARVRDDTAKITISDDD